MAIGPNYSIAIIYLKEKKNTNPIFKILCKIDIHK